MSWRAYLLGQLAEEEQDRLEIELLGGGPALAAIETAADELVEQYLSEELGPDERRAFERYFLVSPEHRRRLEAARGLREAVIAHARRRRKRVAPAWAGLVAAGLAAVVLLLVWSSRRPEAPRVAVEPRPSPSPRFEREVRTASLSLSAGHRMSGERVPTLPPGTADIVRLELAVEDASLVRCRVVLSVAGREVWRSPELSAAPAAGGAMVTADVPAAALATSGSYEASLRAEPSGGVRGTYYFDVRR